MALLEACLKTSRIIYLKIQQSAYTQKLFESQESLE